jgi:hypothetical protein
VWERERRCPANRNVGNLRHRLKQQHFVDGRYGAEPKWRAMFDNRNVDLFDRLLNGNPLRRPSLRWRFRIHR